MKALLGTMAALLLLVLALMLGGGLGGAGSADLSAVPEEYRADVQRAGSICPEITPDLIAAQIEAESGWNPNAVSPAGARGIAQFMPSTWAAAGRDGDGDGRAEITNPHDAIAAQGHYMCRQVALLKTRGYGGDIIDLALAAYNAGLGNVDTYHGIPPFKETRAYVARIRTQAAKYQGSGVIAAAASQGGWSYPLPRLYPITSPFGWRVDPITGGGAMHDGTDYGAPCGEKVLAARSGVVSEVSVDQYGALYVRIEHGTIGGHRYRTGYWHLSAQNVRPGQKVTPGTVIGRVGTTGYSTGCHLHLYMTVDGRNTTAHGIIPNS